MTDTQIASVVVRLFAGMMALGAIACGNSPTRPTAAPAISAASAWAAIAGDAATPVTLAQCLGGSRNTSCFSGARVHTTSAASAPMTSAPVFNNNQPVLTSGPTVTLSWTPPASRRG